MANIKTFLENEISKGNTLIHKDGTITSFEKVKKKLEKEYRKGIAKGEIPLDVMYSSFEHDSLEDYTQIETVLADLKQSAVIWEYTEKQEII